MAQAIKSKRKLAKGTAPVQRHSFKSIAALISKYKRAQRHLAEVNAKIGETEKMYPEEVLRSARVLVYFRVTGNREDPKEPVYMYSHKEIDQHAAHRESFGLIHTEEARRKYDERIRKFHALLNADAEAQRDVQTRIGLTALHAEDDAAYREFDEAVAAIVGAVPSDFAGARLKASFLATIDNGALSHDQIVAAFTSLGGKAPTCETAS